MQRRTEPCISRASVLNLQHREVGSCKKVIFALGVSSPTETTMLQKGKKSDFLEESSIDFDDFEASAKFAFSPGGCCKTENFNPCAGQEGILFCFWPSVAL